MLGVFTFILMCTPLSTHTPPREPFITSNVFGILVTEMVYVHSSIKGTKGFHILWPRLNSVNELPWSQCLPCLPPASCYCLFSCELSSLFCLPCTLTLTQDGGKEVLSMHQILLYLLRCSKALVPEEEIANMLQWEELEWQKYAEECKGMIVTNPGTVCSALCTPRG